MTFLISLFGSLISRLHGGGFLDMPRWLRNTLWTTPIACGVMYAYIQNDMPWYWIAAAAFSSFALCYLGKASGHGQWFLSLAVKAIEAEKLDFIVNPFFGQDPRTKDYLKEYRSQPLDEQPHLGIVTKMHQYGMKKLYWRNVFGLALSGLAAVSGAVAALCFVSPLCAVIMALGGILKAPAYVLFENTARAEYLTGFFAYAALGVVLYLGV